MGAQLTSNPLGRVSSLAVVMTQRLIEQFLPRFDVANSYSVRVAAPATIVYEAARNIDLSASPVVRALFALRCMPSAALTTEGLLRLGFKILREDAPRGIVFGLIGQFWTLGGNLQRFEVDDFLDFNTPGFAKAAWSFEVHDDGKNSLLSTDTRALCLDSASRRRFRRYWLIVRPFSGIIRREALRLVKLRSESLLHST